MLTRVIVGPSNYAGLAILFLRSHPGIYPAIIIGMLTMLRILGLVASLNNSTGAVVDRVEGNVAVVCMDVSCLDVPANLVGPEGTVYGADNSAEASAIRTRLSAHDNGGDIKL